MVDCRTLRRVEAAHIVNRSILPHLQTAVNCCIITATTRIIITVISQDVTGKLAEHKHTSKPKVHSLLLSSNVVTQSPAQRLQSVQV